MSNENNDEQDVLKKLRDVRRKLQESLDDDSTVSKDSEEFDSSKILVDGQAEYEKEDKKRLLEAKEKSLKKKKPKLYKAGAAPKKEKTKKFKKAPTKTGISAKKMAGIQKRIQTKVASRQGMSRKKKALMLVAMVVAATPLLFVTTLSMTTCEFDIDGITFDASEASGGEGVTRVSLYLPVHNPGLLPATIGSLKLELWDQGDSHIADVQLLDPVTIRPKGSTRLSLFLDLKQEETGDWIEELLDDFLLKISIRNFKYNGINMPGGIMVPPIELLDMILGLVGGLTGDDLMNDLGGLFGAQAGQDTASYYNNLMYQYTGVNPGTGEKNLWKMADYQGCLDGIPTPYSAQSFDTDNMFLDITESADAFNINISLPFGLDPIDGFDLGTIKVSDLVAAIYVNATESNPSGNHDDYQYKLIELKTYASNKSGRGDIHIKFGGNEGSSEANVFLNITKDKIETANGEHPSAVSNLDWDDPVAVANYLDTAPQDAPLHYFFYNLLANKQLDCVIALEQISLEIFGITIENVSIRKDLLPILKMDLSSLLGDGDLDLSGLFEQTPIFSMMGGVGILAEMASTGGMAFSKYMTPMKSSNLESSRVLDINNLDLDAILDMDALDLDGVLDSLVEDMEGADAHLGLSLGLGIKAFPIDLALGIKGAKLGLESTVDGVTREFARLEITGNDSDIVYFDGYNSSAIINLDLKLFTNSTCAPHVAELLKQAVGGIMGQDVEVDLTATAHFDNLILFQENYTLPSLDLKIAVGSLIQDLLEPSLLNDLVADLAEDALTPDAIIDLIGGDEESAEPQTPFGISGNPFTAPIEAPLKVLFNNPVMQYIMSDEGRSRLGSGNIPIESSQDLETSDDLDLIVEETADSWRLNVNLRNLDLGDGLLPITLGIGPAELDLYGKNQLGEWEKSMSVEIKNSFDLSGTINLNIVIDIYYDGPICDWLYDLLDEGIINLKLDGEISLEISGVDVKNLDLGLEIEDLDTGFNLTATIPALIPLLTESSANGVEILGEPELLDDTPDWWASDPDPDKLPFVSQDINFDELFEMGDFNIYGLSETGWPNVDSGEVTLSIGLELTNYIVDLGIDQVELELWSDDPTLPSATKLLTLSSTDTVLTAGFKTELVLDITLYKSQDLEDWINGLLETFEITGYATANISLSIFDCVIGPIGLAPEYALNLAGMLDLQDLIGSLLEASVPLYYDEEALENPETSQDIEEIIGKYAGLYVKMLPDTYDPNCGPQNWVDPLLDVRLGLALMPNMNMSILDTNIQLLDKTIYDAVYDESEDNQQEAVHYATIGNLSFVPGNLYFNNTYSSPGDPTNYAIDEEKPYYIPGDAPGEGTLYYQDPGGGAVPYSLGTYFQFEAAVRLYNLSYGSYETKYPRHLWERMGGPYFPVKRFGPEYGGFPYHRMEYHEHFSPLYNLLAGALTDFDMANMDIGALIGGIQLAGQIKLEIFSMEIELDLGSPIISNLVGGLLEGLELGLKEMVKVASNPFSLDEDVVTENQYRAMDNTPGFPEAADGFDDIAIDYYSFLYEIMLGAFLDRNNHLYAPQYGGWGGTNVDPSSPGYVGGLYDADDPATYSSSNQEWFHKDQYYEKFKVITENYRNSVNLASNPYFETRDEDGNYISDPEQWPLAWQLGTGRTRTMVMDIMIACGLRIPVGVLGGFFHCWIDDPQRPCQVAPFGYMWINESVWLEPVDPESDEWQNYWERSNLIDDNGDPPNHDFYLSINLRGFEGPAYESFLAELLDEFDIRLVIGGLVNVSLFGYEIYNIGFEPMAMGEESYFYDRCEEYRSQQGGGEYIYDRPNLDGYVPPEEPPEDPEGPSIPPEEFLPEYKDLDILDFLNLDTLLLGLLGGGDFGGDIGDIIEAVWNIAVLLFSTITIDDLSSEGITLKTNPLELNAVLSAFIVLEEIEIGLMKNTVSDPVWQDIPEDKWAEMARVVSEQNIEMCDYPGKTTPYNFEANPLEDISFHQTWVIQPIEIYIPWDLLDGINVLQLIIALISGDEDDIRDALGGYFWIRVTPFIVRVGIPVEFDYSLEILVNPDDLAFELGEMIGGM